jgi:uncharacterized alkaline shock family protein YloU
MIDDAKLTALIENDIMSFEDVSRFPDIGLSGNIQRAIGRDIPENGIKITDEDDGLTISCELIVYFGVNIPQLCYDIQTKVKGNVEKLTGLTVKAVNIKVDGIDKRTDN